MLWEERRPYSWLLERREEARAKGDIGYFFQEYQNVPMDDSFRVFKKDDIQYYDGYYTREGDIDYVIVKDGNDSLKIPINIFMGVDPASSENIKANYTVIMVVGVDAEFNVYVIDYFRCQVSPMDGAEKIFELSEMYNPKYVNIEETGHVMLADYMERTSKETGVYLHINRKKAIQKKFYRIKSMQPMFASKSVFLKNEHYDLQQELLGFKEHSTSTKDTLDALRWATDDIYAPNLELTEGGEWQYPEMSIGADWETGELIYN